MRMILLKAYIIKENYIICNISRDLSRESMRLNPKLPATHMINVQTDKEGITHSYCRQVRPFLKFYTIWPILTVRDTATSVTE